MFDGVDEVIKDRNEGRMRYARGMDYFRAGDKIMKVCEPYFYAHSGLQMLNNYVTLNSKKYDAAGRLKRVIVTCEYTGAHFLYSAHFDGWINNAVQSDYFRLEREQASHCYTPTHFLVTGTPL
jgi:hypothetical protein